MREIGADERNRVVERGPMNSVELDVGAAGEADQVEECLRTHRGGALLE
jgi:hypothetical protein